jgi:hypothetical protein
MLAAVVPKDNVFGSRLYRFWQRFATRAPAPRALPAILPGPALPGCHLRGRSLAQLARPDTVLPDWVAEDAIARRYLHLLGALDWDHFPERPTGRPWPGKQPADRAPMSPPT